MIFVYSYYKIGMVNYSSIYPGATYLLDPSYNYIGYRIPIGDMGGTTSIQTANQLKEVSKLLNQGMKTTEVSVINPDVFEMMPKEHLKEINRLNKLTGAESTLHAPIIDPSGFTEQGWNEENREAVERQFTNFVIKSHELSPEGNMPVTIHASQIPGSVEIPKTHRLVTEEERNQKGPILGRMIAVNQETGQLVPLEREEKFYPGVVGEKGEGKVLTPQREIEILNTSHWDNQLSQLVFYKERADELVEGAIPLVMQENLKDLNYKQEAALSKIRNANTYYENVQQSMLSLFHNAYKYSDPKRKEELKKISDKFREDLDYSHKKLEKGDEVGYISAYGDSLQRLIRGMQVATSPVRDSKGNIIPAPQLFAPIEKFAGAKASETLSNVAVSAYNKYGMKAPIVSIENPPYGGALSSGKDLKDLVNETRKKFEEKLVKEGKSRSEAKAAAERLIGVTWDTSHMNMIRKQGFGPERIVQDTKEVAGMVKHLHYNDNFGTTHTDLPPGMGSVPFKDVLKELEKGGFAGKRIFEGGNFFQHFQTSPFVYTLESGGSPIYSAGGAPFWNQLGAPGVYYAGHGSVNPALHHSIYGAGFQTLPLELGGEIPGGQSRFSGAPNQ